jgi:diaminopimelate decarboxylase
LQIRHAAARGINLTTFDTVGELHKLAKHHPATQALLRIRADDTSALCCLGDKYGAEPADAPALLVAAARLGIAVVGVSFHVGSASRDPRVRLCGLAIGPSVCKHTILLPAEAAFLCSSELVFGPSGDSTR